MHELTITQSLLDLALRHAERAGAARIVSMQLVVGDLASVVDESVQFYWDIISQGTLAEGARLTFERVPARMRCHACGQEYLLERGELACPHCDSTRVSPCAGTEFLLDSIEVVATEDEASADPRPRTTAETG